MKKDYQNRAAYWFALLLLLTFSTPGFSNNGNSNGGKHSTNAAPLAGPFYPSTTGGTWNSGNAWSVTGCNTASGLSWPTTSADNVNITCAKTITASASSFGGALTITGGTLIIPTGTTVIVTSLNMTSGTLTVNGTLNITQGGTGAFTLTGGTFTQTATGTVTLSGGLQDINCSQPFYNLNIAGSNNKTMLTDITVKNTLSLISNNLLVGSKTLNIGTSSSGTAINRTNGRITTTALSSLSFGGGTYTQVLGDILSNTWPVTLANFSTTRNLATISLGTSQNLTVTGAFNLSAGDFIIGSNTLTLNGTISGNINGALVGGANSNLIVGGSGAASMYFDLSNTAVGGSNTIRNFTNNRTSHSFVMLSSLRIGGTLAEVANASLTITASGFQGLTIDGNVSGNAPLVGHSSATLSILGSGAMGGSISFVNNQTLSSLTMNRFSSGTATLNSPVSLGSLHLTSGVLTNSFVTTVTGSAASNVTNSGTSHLAGALARTIAPNTTATSYLWPIGKSFNQKFVLNGVTTSASGNVVIQAEAFDGNSGGTFDATMASKNTDNFWRAQVTSNASNLTSVGTATITDANPTLVAGNVIGYATTQNGEYTSLGGVVAAPSITSIISAPVELGYYSLGTAGVSCTQPDVPTLSATSSENCGTLSTTLNISSGALNSATDWQWYTGLCGGTSLGSGSSIIVSPTSTTTYFVRGEGGCVTPGICATITITVNTPQNWYLDADNDGHYVGTPIDTCNSPGIGYNTTATMAGDCDDSNDAIYQNATFYIDADADGYDAGTTVVCYGNEVPAGYSGSTLGSDCNDSDSSVYQSAILFIDMDSDGYDNGTQTVCYATTIPTGYSWTTIGSDCNDNNASMHAAFPFYADSDADGFGAGNAVNLCAVNATTPPTGYSTNNTDCNDSIAAINPGASEILYDGVDNNCNNILDEGFQIKTKLLPSACGATLASIGSLIGITTVASNITMYRIRVTNGTSVQIIERNVPHFSLPNLPVYNYATTYGVDIMLQRNGIWLGYYGDSCLVSSPAILAEGGAAQITPSQCGITLPRINSLIATTSLPGVTGYRFKVTNITAGATGPNVIQTIDRVQNWFSLPMLTQYNFGSTYRVEVAVKTNGAYSGYGNPCEVTSPAIPSLTNCGIVVQSPSTFISTTSLPGVSQYRFQVIRLSDNATTTMDRNTNYFTFNSVPGYSPGVPYGVRVAVMTVGTWSPYSDLCEITSPGTASRFGSNVVSNVDSTLFSAVAYPNPFASNVSIKVNTSATEELLVGVYDMTGRLIEAHQIAPSDFGTFNIGDAYPSGVYNVIVSQGDHVETLRIIKR